MAIDGTSLCLYFLGKASQYLKTDNLLEYLREIDDRKELINGFEAAVKDVPEFETKSFGSIYDFRLLRLALYCLVRELKPEVVVETGVMHGLGSAFILKALRNNESGKLISIDAPSYNESGPVNQDGYNEVLPRGKEAGWIVSEADREGWDLRVGKSEDLLAATFQENAPIDLFIHDSEHTYENMWMEMKSAWKVLRPGGVLICDNIEANSSFHDFCEEVQCESLLCPAPDTTYSTDIRFGIVRK